MTEAVYGAISAGATFGAVLMWVAVVRRESINRRVLLLGAVAAVTVGALTLMALVLPRGPQLVGTVVVGLALSAALILLWTRYASTLEPTQSRLLLGLGIAGIVFVLLEVLLDFVRN